MPSEDSLAAQHVSIDPEAFARGWLGATQRYLKIAEALGDLGWSVAVVTGRSRADALPEVDAAYPGEVFRTPFGVYPAALNRRKLRNGWNRLRGLCGMPSGDYVWATHLAGWFSEHRPDSPLALAKVLCAVTYGNWGGLGAARTLAGELGVPYWIDAQDPLRGTADRGSVSLSDEHRLLLVDAARIVTTTTSYARWLRQAFPEVADKVDCIRSPYAPSLVRAMGVPSQDGRVRLLYGGYLDGLPALSAVPLLDAMARLFGQSPSARPNLTLRLVGGGPGMREAVIHAKRLGLAANLEYLPPVDPGTLGRHIGEADVLCLFMPHLARRDYQVPSKLAEYLFSSKPILAVTPPGETADIVLETGAGYVVHPTETERLASVLAELLQRKQDTGTVAVERDPDKVRPFSFEVFREKLEGILSAAL